MSSDYGLKFYIQPEVDPKSAAKAEAKLDQVVAQAAAAAKAGNEKVLRDLNIQAHQMMKKGGNHLLAGPEFPRFANRRGKKLDIHVRFDDFKARKARQRCKYELLILPLLKECVFTSHLDTSIDVILDQSSERRAIRWHNVLQISIGDEFALGPSIVTLGEVAIHLISIVIGVVRVAVWQEKKIHILEYQRRTTR